jgi:tetratricopeptide (TPR) repeat protein
MISPLLRVLAILCTLTVLVPWSARADSGGSSDTTFNQQVSPEQVTAAYQQGYQRMKAGQYQEAIEAFKHVIELNDQHAMAYTNMAYSYRKLGHYKRAVKFYKKALAIEPNLAEAHEYMGAALLAMGKVEEAKEHLAVLEKLDNKLAESLRAEIARHDRS